jgi:hypothetical protein
LRALAVDLRHPPTQRAGCSHWERFCQRSRQEVSDGNIIRLRGSNSGSFEESEDLDRAAEMMPAISADMLAMNSPDALEVSDLIEGTVELPGRRDALEASHGSVSIPDPAVILFKPIIEIDVRPMPHHVAEFAPDRGWVGIVTVGSHPDRHHSRTAS